MPWRSSALGEVGPPAADLGQVGPFQGRPHGAIEQGLVEGLRQHPAGLGLVDVVSVAANAADHYGQSAGQGLQQDDARCLLVGRVDEQIRREENPRDIVAGAQKNDAVRHAEPVGPAGRSDAGNCLPPRRARSAPQRLRQGSQGQDRPVQPLAPEIGTQLQHEPVVLSEAPDLPEGPADLRSLRPGEPVPRHIRRHPVDAVACRAVVLHVQLLLDRREHQDLRPGVRPEYRLLKTLVEAIPRQEPVEAAMLLQGLGPVAYVRGEVDVQAGHLLEADHARRRMLRQAAGSATRGTSARVRGWSRPWADGDERAETRASRLPSAVV